MRNLPPFSLEQAAYHDSAFGEVTRCRACSARRAEQISDIVRHTGLTISQVSSATISRYGKDSTFFVPPSFLHKQREGVSPHICQVLALSEVTGYRFRDWVRVWGFDLRWIFPLQLRVHVDRTVLVNPDPSAGLACLAPAPSKSTSAKANKRYVFAKIGRSDAVLDPAIPPGSVVRADRCYPPDALHDSPSENRRWLVEHPGGLACCRITRVGEHHIILGPNRPPLPSWPLQLNTEARVLGLVDLELHPQGVPERSTFCVTKFAHRPLSQGIHDETKLSTLIRASRSRVGLTLRGARDMTATIARLLGDRDYDIALGQLSDYEAADRLPRRIAKLISLCAVYGMDPFDLMATTGVEVNDSGKMPLPFHEDALDQFHAGVCHPSRTTPDYGTKEEERIRGLTIGSQFVA